MKKLLGLILLISASAFAGNYNVDGVQFSRGTVITSYKVFPGDDSAVCEMKLIFSKVKGSATCSKLTMRGVASFVGMGALTNLLVQVKDQKWSNDETEGSTLSCKIWLENMNEVTNEKCRIADEKQGSVSKE